MKKIDVSITYSDIKVALLVSAPSCFRGPTCFRHCRAHVDWNRRLAYDLGEADYRVKLADGVHTFL